ncbi:MAG: thiamine phosphate synthase [Rikenellaceae bacterium]
MRKVFDLSLYLVTDRDLSLDRDLEWIVSEAVRGGVTMVQLREKNCSTSEFIALAQRLKSALKPYNVALVANDRVDVVLAADLDGVHIGQSDMSYSDARALLGEDKIIGLSVENMTQVEDANSLDVDYIGISPLFATPTKTDTSEPFGLEGCRTACEISRHKTVVIGGLNKSNVKDAISSGADGVAVVSAIVSADNPCNAAQELISLIKG